MIHDPPKIPLTQSLRQILDDLDRLRPEIQAALDYADGTHTFDDITAMVLHGKLRFWPLQKSALLTEVVEFPQEKHYHMFLGGGDLQEILEMHPQVEQAARQAGCTKLSVTGRRGWVRALEAHGWQLKHVTCVKRLD
jgi:hypothetical protein